jgi:dCMP deaminase
MKKLTINPNRIEIDEAYMQMAEVWAKRSKANRLQVGALLVKNGQIISDGYNGMPAGAEGDDDVCEEYADPEGYDGQDGLGGPPDKVIKTKHEVLHAEANALLKLVANGGMGAAGATLYCTYSPCPECAKLITQAKVARVVFRNHYRLPEGIERLEKRGVVCEQLQAPLKQDTEQESLDEAD